MTELITPLPELEDFKDMGSWNHSFVQSRLVRLLPEEDRFVIHIELSLVDISTVDLSPFDIKAKDELRPDICLYPASQRGLSKPRDKLKIAEMPLLVIEILSPKQGIDDILAKFQVYFTLGVKSCWLVAPAIEIVTIYSSMVKFSNFAKSDVELIDEILNIRLPMEKIFY
jgi:Uma2 family endonuclease